MMRIATRGSRLARWQAEHVGARLAGDVEYVLVETHGDADQTSDIHRMGGQGVFVKEVQQAVLDGRADIAVHSAKDLPAVTAHRPRPRVDSGTGRPARRARRSSRSMPFRPADVSVPAPCAAGPSSRTSDPTSHSARCAGTSRRACASASTRATTRSSSRMPRWNGSASAAKSPTCWTRRSCCRRSRKARSVWNAVPVMTRHALASKRSTTSTRTRR